MQGKAQAQSRELVVTQYFRLLCCGVFGDAEPSSRSPSFCPWLACLGTVSENDLELQLLLIFHGGEKTSDTAQVQKYL